MNNTRRTGAEIWGLDGRTEFRLDVPAYVIRSFESEWLGEPYDDEATLEVKAQEAFRLVSQTLAGCRGEQWVVADGLYMSTKVDKPLGLHREGPRFYIYREQYKRRKAIALFHHVRLACDYFVWRVSSGRRKISWPAPD